MKFFGYIKGNKDELFHLSEVTLEASPATLKLVANFLLKCANEMEQNEFWEHEHYADKSADENRSVDFIVFRDMSSSRVKTTQQNQW